MFFSKKFLIFSLLGLLGFSPLAMLSAQDCNAGEVEIKIVVVADDYPEEINWVLRDANETPLATGTEGEYKLCAPPGNCQSWTIADLANDGICCNNGLGYYQIFIDGVEIASGGDYHEGTSHNLNCPVGTDCASPLPIQTGAHATGASDNWYRFQPSELGSYKISTCNEQSCETTVFVYEECSTSYDLTPLGSLAYNQNGCANGNSVTAVGLSNEKSYLIRIHSEICSENLDWDLTFEGAVTGCMDGTACNFDPFATLSGSCLYLPDENCPGGRPDLQLDEAELIASFSLDTEEITDQCLINEGCATGYGQREIIRFTTKISNIGDADFVLGSPNDSDISHQFEWDQCHQHWHYEGYAAYQLFDVNEQPLPTGFKNGFCVLDLVCPSADMYRYTCGTMGISAGCSDTYTSGMPCQWLDITDVPDGFYTLVVKVNWDESTDQTGRAESDYSNNQGKVCFNLSRTNGVPSIELVTDNCNPPLDCEGVAYGLAVPDCSGICNGTTLSGDLDNNGLQNFEDVAALVQSVLQQEPQAMNPCNDLNGDGKLNIVDAYYLYGCYKQNFGGQAEDPNNDLCAFPYGNTNLQQTTVFSLLELNVADSYVDLGIQNALNEIVAFEFDLEGIEIDYVVSLLEQDALTLSIDKNADLGKVTGYAISQDPIRKNVEMVPFLRIYFDDFQDNQVCLSAVEAVVNELYEEVNFEITDNCLESVVSGIENELSQGNPKNLRVAPNPFKERTRINFSNPTQDEFTLKAYDSNGSEVLVIYGIIEEELIVEGLNPGEIYTFILFSKQLYYTGRFICL